MIRLVAIDMDDTTLLDNRTLGQRTIHAIRAAAAAGITVVPATGRAASSVLPYVQQIGLQTPVISYQGGVITASMPGGQVWQRHEIDPTDAAQVILELKQRGLYAQIYQEDGIIYEQECEQSREYERISGMKGRAVGALEQAVSQPPLKVLSILQPSLANSLQRQLSQQFAGRLTVTISKPNFLEFTHPLASKGAALEYVANRLGIPQQQTAAVGDSMNDITMIRWAHLGCAVENARQELKQQADRILPSNAQQGVAQFLEGLIAQTAGR